MRGPCKSWNRLRGQSGFTYNYNFASGLVARWGLAVALTGAGSSENAHVKALCLASALKLAMLALRVGIAISLSHQVSAKAKRRSEFILSSVIII